VEWSYSGVTNANRVVNEVDQFELRICTLRCDVVRPLGDCVAVTTRTGAIDIDAYVDHVSVLSLSLDGGGPDPRGKDQLGPRCTAQRLRGDSKLVVGRVVDF
jgi:hypothetical protein